MYSLEFLSNKQTILALTSLAYEKWCVLFNIAALQSAVAASQSMESDDSLKSATKLFQQSAGIFLHLKGIITPTAIPQEPTPDLTPETLHVLANLMVAQAQEVFVIKAIRDNMKDAIIAKLACQCEKLYAEVLQDAQKDGVRALWERDWLPKVSFFFFCESRDFVAIKINTHFSDRRQTGRFSCHYPIVSKSCVQPHHQMYWRRNRSSSEGR